MHTRAPSHPTAAEDCGNDEGQQAAGKVRRAITRATREQAALVHRTSALSLVGRALLHDRALQDEELQVGKMCSVVWLRRSMIISESTCSRHSRHDLKTYTWLVQVIITIYSCSKRAYNEACLSVLLWYAPRQL
jgi:hypothetical protein